MERLRIKIAGESGAGLLSTGEIVMRALQDMGYYLVADREYPSIIKGEHACFTINASSEPVHALCQEVDVMMAIERQSLEVYIDDLKDGGVLVYGQERQLNMKETLEKAEGRGVQFVHQNARTIAIDNGGSVLMQNIVLVGMLWKTLGFPYEFIEAEVKRKFASKPRLLAIDLKCLKEGYDGAETKMELKVPETKNDTILMNGTKSIALGAIHAGCRAYFAYPMSPSSGILKYLAEYASETDMLVKQVEDEISVANMALGAMHMGTRALCGTAGGGFDLMTETVSLAGIIETPFVVVIAQRPGPATGLPTWTGQGDLDLAIYGGHGEFPRIVIGCGDSADSFDLIQHAFNLAEEFQTAVMVMTEKAIVKSQWTIPAFEQEKIPVVRGLAEGEKRYEITESGLSNRWLPGTSDNFYYANSDEHLEDGSLTEAAGPAGEMYAKRMRKLDLIEDVLPEPEIYGPKDAKISFVGWGSSKNVMRDVIAERDDVNYLHFSFVWPLKVDVLKKFFEENKNVHLIEGNYNGQFGNLVQAKAEVKFDGRLLKWDGRSIFVDEVINYIDEQTK